MNNKLPIITKTIVNRNRSKGGDFFRLYKNYLRLEDGTEFSGRSPEWLSGNYNGEVVFNTGMTGYVESLTDPSYAGQILVFTYPLIGNYGVQFESLESDKIQVRGVVVGEIARDVNNSQSDCSLLSWLKSQNIPVLSGVDTRALTKHLRIKGTMNGVIGIKASPKQSELTPADCMISIKKPRNYNTKNAKKIILVDCGTKENIVRSLLKFPVHVKRVPYDYDYTHEQYDGVLVSNGPGNPTDYQETITILRRALARKKPVFGICLGNQIMGLAAGAKTYKLTYGHRGHNQPCINEVSRRCYMTSQNHGYAIDEKSLPKGWAVSFRNLNDNSIEGIQHESKPFFSVQFHPEACPGPTDTAWLFNEFYSQL